MQTVESLFSKYYGFVVIMNSTETLVVVHLSATAVYTVIGSIVSRDDILH